MLAERATPLAETQESAIRVLRRPVFLLAGPCLPLGFECINIPPGRHGLGLFVGGRLEMDIKQIELFFPILQFGIKRKPFRGLDRIGKCIFPIPKALIQQNPQRARRNNFPGEQISGQFLLLSGNLSASNYPGPAIHQG